MRVSLDVYVVLGICRAVRYELWKTHGRHRQSVALLFPPTVLHLHNKLTIFSCKPKHVFKLTTQKGMIPTNLCMNAPEPALGWAGGVTRSV